MTATCQRPRVAIAGAGLGGCMLAQALADTHDVTLVERPDAGPDGPMPVKDVGRPAIVEPHLAFGLGGSTQLWHNGLVEIDDDVFARHWPFGRAELSPYYDRAFRLLSGGDSPEVVRQAIVRLRDAYRAIGYPEGIAQGLYYPRAPMNVWKTFKLAGRVRVVRAAVHDLEIDASGRVLAFQTSAAGADPRVTADHYVLAAGGLGTPVLLQRLATHCDAPALRHAGCFYEDHPMCFVGELESDRPLYKLWNYGVPGAKGGSLRIPLTIDVDGLHVSFHVRPSSNVSGSAQRERMDTALNDLRRELWNPRVWLKVLKNRDDVLDILSFRFGIRLPTRHYSLLMVAQQIPRVERSVWAERGPVGEDVIVRRWTLYGEDEQLLRRGVDEAMRLLAPVTSQRRTFPAWMSDLHTSAHHSGTARIARSADEGVCDADTRVHGLQNLFVCDGSVIPASGIANTGLTIGALALRLADHLKAQPLA